MPVPEKTIPEKLIPGAKFLITGGAGFIGSHLADYLLNLGAAEVRVLDNLRCGKWSNLSEAEATGKVVRFEQDLALMGPEDFRECLDGVDYVYHLAAEKYNQSVGTPEQVIAVNITGTHRLCQAAVAAGVKKLVFTSSLYAYGRLALPPMVETQPPEPWTIYGMTKVAGENLMRHFAKTEGLATTTFRLFFVYGPRQFAGMGYKSVIMVNFERILQGQAPVIFGDGEQSLDYVYIGDVVRALGLALSPAVDGEIFNIGSGRAISVNDLTAQMLSVSGASLRPVSAPADWTAGTCRVSNPDLAREKLGWEAEIPMPDGLGRVLHWMNPQLNTSRILH